MSIRNRIVLIAGLVLATVTLLLGALVERRLEEEARRQTVAQIETAVETARELDRQRNERLAIQAELLSEVLPLSRALQQGDRQAAGDLVDELAARARTADMVVVFDATGNRFADSGRSDHLVAAVPPTNLGATWGARLSGEDPLVAIDGRLYAVLSRPITAPATGSTLGTVIVAEEIDSRAAEDLARLTHSDVVLVVGEKPTASSLPMGTAAEAVTVTAGLEGGESREVTLRGRRYLARLDPLSADGTRRLLLIVVDPTFLAGTIDGQILLLGLLAVGLALPLLWLAGHPLQRSLRHLSNAMAETAVTGRLDRSLPNEGTGAWSPPEVERLEASFSSLMGTVEQSLRDRERSYVEAIGAVVAAIDARDHETTGHSFRVAHYALALARLLDIEGERLRAIEWGALLHDVGKIAVPDAILRKSDRLTEEEWHVMRQHPNWGFEMLADVKFLEPALEIVYSHHERWDGSGYPRGLGRDQIPLAARIFSVVDTYDSITSDRPYRRARSHAEAITELCRVAGTQLDPDVVEAFLHIPEVDLRRLRERSLRLDFSVRIPEAVTDLPSAGASRPS